jgi:hypothetical protein
MEFSQLMMYFNEIKNQELKSVWTITISLVQPVAAAAAIKNNFLLHCMKPLGKEEIPLSHNPSSLTKEIQ